MADARRLRVNGVRRDLDPQLDPETPLLHVLRWDLNLRGTRAGCSVGECGACTVLVDQLPVRSCTTPLSTLQEHQEITTPEGLGTPEDPHPAQQVFLDEQAAQCGYCLNGIIMATAALTAAAHPPDPQNLRSALAEHLCRCGAHQRILWAAERLAGREPPRVDAVVRETGAAHPTAAQSAADPADPVEPPDASDPAALRAFPCVEDWLRPLPDGRVEARSGRVELGQGVRTALAQLVAAELDLPADAIVVRPTTTEVSPDEGYTAGSMSLEQGGRALGRAAAAYRRRVAAGEPPTGPIEPRDQPRRRGATIGQSVPRADLQSKLTGAPAYLHDLALPGMVHARAVLPPTYEARPIDLDPSEATGLPGVLAVEHDGGVVVVVAEREDQAVRAARRLARSIRWSAAPLVEPATEACQDKEVPEPVLDEPDVEGALASGVRRVAARYAKPHEAHASVAPSAALARVDRDQEGDQISVWTHNQGVYPLRRELSAAFGVAEAQLHVQHVDGPGCYGHNGADDAAGFAVVAARAVPPRPVRFVFSASDELGWEPYGPPMSADLEAAVDGAGRLTGWRSRIRTGTHSSRPTGSGERLAVTWLRSGGPARPWAGGGEGGVRNAVPAYAVPARDIAATYAPGPLRTSALRTLGAFLNVFAIESFMDELAEAAGVDPVQFRLAQLSDVRARTVLEHAAEVAGWRSRVGPSGRGMGVALARYKNAKSYVAQVIEADVDQQTGTITVQRIVIACDAGVVVNPDGLRNQLEGGALQGLSRALHEQVRYTNGGVTSTDWSSYPVLGFAEVPALETVLIDRRDQPPLGAGEAATPVTPAALANAVDDRIGVRLRELPLTPQRLRSRLEELDGAEADRVVLDPER